MARSPNASIGSDSPRHVKRSVPTEISSNRSWPRFIWVDTPTLVRPEVRSLLADLRHRGQSYGVFTNDLVHLFGDDWPQSFPEISNARWFIDANAAGALKPAAAAFKAAMDIVGKPAEHIVFLDDDHLNIEAATKYGMTAVLLDVAEPHHAITHVRTLPEQG